MHQTTRLNIAMKFTLSRLLPLVVGSAAAGVLALMSPASGIPITTYEWTINGVGLKNSGSGTFTKDGNLITSWSGQFGGKKIKKIIDAGGFLSNDNTWPISGGLFGGGGVSWEMDGGTKYKIFKNTNPSLFSPSYFTLEEGKSPVDVDKFNAKGVPFDISGSATIPAVGALLLAARWKARKSIASKTRTANPDVAVP
ncbi:hypothetical protein ANA_C20365 [Anabaena sp. 90]|uniref:hypothetical protein n=1 Tax=Anabaena sp. 90 TaxID=46234 RepID=UPI00029B6952|nr:hypothetical protein [Anabaena sp. 90]AFW96809.1 hypothetical protein ANA_C20365 [Anabaena sp. 90]